MRSRIAGYEAWLRQVLALVSLFELAAVQRFMFFEPSPKHTSLAWRGLVLFTDSRMVQAFET